MQQNLHFTPLTRRCSNHCESRNLALSSTPPNLAKMIHLNSCICTLYNHFVVVRNYFLLQVRKEVWSTCCERNRQLRPKSRGAQFVCYLTFLYQPICPSVCSWSCFIKRSFATFWRLGAWRALVILLLGSQNLGWCEGGSSACFRFMLNWRPH